MSACAACIRESGETPPEQDAGWSFCRCQEEFPVQLLDLGDRTPPVLFGRGAKDAVAGLDSHAAVTIVGSRRATSYGLEVARELSQLLATAGLTVVSGMAFGIDSAAHEGALRAGGTTIAVLAGGPDVAYPPSKRRLHRRILESGGAAIAERAPGVRPEKWSFPARNRIMAALSAMTVVVEAAEPSGSLITATDAGAMGRILGAVPGPVTSRASAGTHGLIKDSAVLIRDAQDVLDELLGVGCLTARAVGPPLDPELTAILDMVEAGHATLDALSARHGDARAAAVALARLELMGYVQADLTGAFGRTALATPD